MKTYTQNDLPKIKQEILDFLGKTTKIKLPQFFF